MLPSERVVLLVSSWIVASTVISVVFFGSTALEVMFILSLIGVLVIRELNDALTTVDLRQRFDVFIYMGSAVFALIVVVRVLRILGALP